MKKLYKIFAFVALTVLCFCSFVACSKADPAGKWVASTANIYYEMKGIQMDIDMDFEDLGITIEIDLNKDGSFVQYLNVPEMPDFGLGVVPGVTIPGQEEFEPIEETITGRWSEKDGKIKLVAENVETNNTTFLTIDGDTLVLEQSMDIGVIAFSSVAVYEKAD